MELTWIILAGFVLDLIVGDPEFIPHPIVFIGRIISFFERLLYRQNSVFRGFVLWITVVFISFIIPLTAIILASYISYYLKIALEVFWAMQIFATTSLRQAAMRVFRAIERGDLQGAKKYLSWIVGRDTENLSYKEITKAVIETVAENTSDGIIAPLFYMAIGGVPLSFLYKAVNTLDSMVGYRNDKYIYFGRFSAKLDDFFNFIPAFITGVFLILGTVTISLFRNVSLKNSLKIFLRDRKNHLSPNSAKPESAMAGALRVRLGGPSTYFGKVVEKKTIGDPIDELTKDKIKDSVWMMYSASIIGLIVIAGIRVAVMVFLIPCLL